MASNLIATWIVSDDSSYRELKRSIESVLDVVDGVIVQTNEGAGTGTDKIQTLATHPKITVTHLAWTDSFADQRNAVFAAAEQAGATHILWMDSDDVFVGAQELPGIVSKMHQTGMQVVFLDYWYACTFDGPKELKHVVRADVVQSRERIIAARAIDWKGRLHETPIIRPHAEGKYTALPGKEIGAYVVHLKADEQWKPALDRNRKMLEMQLRDEEQEGQRDPRTIINLLKIYVEEEQRDMEKIEAFAAEYLNKSGWDEQRNECYRLLADARAREGQYDEAVEALMGAIEEYPQDPHAQLMLARTYLEKKDYRKAKFWLHQALQIDLPKVTSLPINLQNLRYLSAEVLLRMNFRDDYKDVKTALAAAEALYQIAPTEQNEATVQFLSSADKFSQAFEHFAWLFTYFDDIGKSDIALSIIEALPDSFTSQPLMVRTLQKLSKPKVWGEKEIAIIAHFGGPHFEAWSAKSIEKGIGGSETAVIELAKRWQAMGYQVVVYGDPRDERGEHDGVLYLPWYALNRKDQFNIVIQWRNASYAGKIKAKRFYVDLHDMVDDRMFDQEVKDAVDGWFFKSAYHASLAPSLPKERVHIIGNGAI